MADNEIITHTDDKKAITPAASDNAEPLKDIIYINENHSHKKEGKGDDVMLTQFILCLLLVLSVFLLRFVNEDFQKEIFSMYSERTNANAEPFIAAVFETIENWFKK